ncbi:copper resistance protein CopC/CopD [Streptomyces sp. LX-29]|uniref:copper resistance protein CopC n=1 Tax=Streptomyces sp. LX-29 TaxID=2900152 RepID=UPI00240DE346|nr:copper resistance protein CopC [Streptomyces sp. LX-29]WFB08401.1 copper resistance protein CopC/CopD [Streptomyces sp. LX-29]
MSSSPTTTTERPARPRRLPGPARLGVLLLAVLACALGFGATPASAHAALTATDPADGAVLPTQPQRVTLTFSEGVLVSDDSVRVLDPRGRRVDDGEPDHRDGESSTMSVALRAGLPDGTYTVAWEAVSEDSHPVGGAFTFSIGAPSATTVSVPTTAEPDPTVDTLYGVGRYAAYAGLVLLVGGCVFAAACRSSKPVERVAAAGWATLFAATVLLLLLRSPYTGGDSLGAALDPGRLDEVLSTKPGAALLARLILLGAAAGFLAVLFGPYARQRTKAAARRELTVGLGVGGAVLAAGLGATWAMAEHASVGIQPWLAMPVDVAHLLAVGVWLGGLVALLVTLRAGEPVPGTAVRRFSRLAFGSVLVLVVTGLYQSWRQVGGWSALTGTEYGRWLLVKVALVAVLVGLAAGSRRWTARLTDAPEPEPAPPGKGARNKATKTRAKAPKAAVREAAAPTATTPGVGTRAAGAPGPGTPGVGSATSGAADAPRHVRAGAGLRTADTRGRADDGGSGDGTDRHDGTGRGDGTGRSDGARAGRRRDRAGAAAGDPVRAAQLARQRAAVDRTVGLRRRDADAERSGLRRAVAVETAVAVVLLAVTTVLTGTQPGRAEAAQAAARAGAAGPAAGPVTVTVPYDTGTKSGRGTAELTVDPARKGANAIHLYLKDRAGRAVDVAELKLSFTLRKQDIGPLVVPLRHLSTGHWSVDRFQLPMAGSWQLSLTVRTSDIDQVTEVKTVKVSP